MDKIYLDTIGLDCPIPLVELKKALLNANDGQIIELTFTCPEAVVNIPSWVKEHGHEVLEYEKMGSKGWRIVIKK